MPTISGTFGNYAHYMDLTINSQSVGGNTSSLHYRYYIHRNVSSGAGSFGGPNTFSITVNGATNSQNLTFDWRAYADRVFIEGDITVGHDAAGNLTVPYSFSFSGFSGAFPAASGSSSYALPRIPKPPTAPTIGSATQTSPTAATVTWSAPSNDNGAAVSGYRITYATNSSFTGASSIDVGNVLSYNVTGLTPGAQYYYEVAAGNVAGYGAYSGSVSAVQVAEIGDLDGWSSTGTLPAGLTPLIGTGLRRGSVYSIPSAPIGLLREIQSTGTGSVTANAFGIQRTFTGLIVGGTYKLNASVVLMNTAPANVYRFSVDSIGAGSTVAATTTPAAIPEYTFVATATSHVIRIQLSETAAWSGSGWWEATGFYGLTLTEVPNTSLQRLQDVALESSLANHFTVACDTVGAAWWVDKENVTQFRQVPAETAIKATFTDNRAVGKLEYTDISSGFDTRNTVNSITVNNHGRDAATGNAKDVSYTAADPTSVSAFGIHSGSMDMSMRSGYVDVTNIIRNPRFANTTSYTSDWGAAFVAGGAATNTQGTSGGPLTNAPTFIRYTVTTSVPAGFVLYTGPDAANVPFTASTLYRVAARVRSSTTLSIRFAIQPYNASNAGVGALIYSPTQVLVANTWTRLNYVLTTPALTTQVRIHMETQSTIGVGQTMDYTALSVTEGTGDPGYFDGSFTDSTGDFVYAWTGTPHLSTSTRTTFEILNDRIAEVLDDYATPGRVITSIGWNAQENSALAASLEVQDRIRVEFRGQTQDSRIVGIKHDLSGTRWMMTLELVAA